MQRKKFVELWNETNTQCNNETRNDCVFPAKKIIIWNEETPNEHTQKVPVLKGRNSGIKATASQSRRFGKYQMVKLQKKIWQQHLD